MSFTGEVSQSLAPSDFKQQKPRSTWHEPKMKCIGPEKLKGSFRYGWIQVLRLYHQNLVSPSPSPGSVFLFWPLRQGVCSQWYRGLSQLQAHIFPASKTPGKKKLLSHYLNKSPRLDSLAWPTLNQPLWLRGFGAQIVQVRFSRPESEQARQRRVQSYEFLQKKHAEEPWVHLHYYGLRDSRSEHERQYLLCQGSSGVENTELVKSPSEYLMMLMPPSQEQEKDKPVAPSNVLSMAQLRTLPLADQIKILMKNVKVMPFANLMSLLGPFIDSVAVLRGIQKVAMLVQGNWVVKSDILYPKDSSSPHSGVPAEVLCRGRDFVMWKFTQSRWVVRKEVATVTKLSAEDVKDFLEHMAVVRINKGWEFILPYDGEFIKKHPDVVQRQHMLWTGIQAKLEKVYNLVKETMPKKPDGQSGPAVLVSGDQRVQVAKSKAQQNHALLERELQRRKEQIRASTVLPGVRIKEEPMSEEGEEEEEREVEEDEEPMDTSPSRGLHNRLANGLPAGRAAGGDSFNGHPPPGCANTPVARELRAFVEATFQRQFVLTLSELKRLFNLHLASLPPGHTLFSGISDRMLQDTVLAAGCKQILVPFPPQTAASPDEQKVFALWESGDMSDQHRQVLLEIFSKNYRVRRNMIQSRLTQECGEDLSKQEVDKVLKDCCVSYGGMWYLKGTVQS
nr:DNA-directed RNA polymerase III subunit RPC5 isoform X5 [Equus asinus]